jgi:hypothetical protein
MRAAAYAVTLTIAATLPPVAAQAAPPAPVTDVVVTPHLAPRQHVGGGSHLTAIVSWTNQDPTADGVSLCVEQSAQPNTDPNVGCDVSKNYPTPEHTSDAIELRQGKAYSFTLWSYSNAEGFSSPVTATFHGTHSEANHLKTNFVYGDHVRFVATLTDTRTDAPLAHEPITLWRNWWPSDTGWHKVSGLTTNRDGVVSVDTQPRHREAYEWRFAGDDGELPSIEEIDLHLAYKITARLTESTAAADEQVLMYGIVRPAVEGKRVKLAEYQSPGSCPAGYYLTGQRVIAKRQRLPNGRTTFGYVMSVSRPTAGTHKFQADVEQDSRLDGHNSRSVALTVEGSAAYRTMARSVPALPAC